MCFAANNILLMRNCNHGENMADYSPELLDSDLRKQIWWANDKTIIEPGYRKISLFVSVSQIKLIF